MAACAVATPGDAVLPLLAVAEAEELELDEEPGVEHAAAESASAATAAPTASFLIPRLPDRSDAFTRTPFTVHGV
jgi:hypothetical protein